MSNGGDFRVFIILKQVTIPRTGGSVVVAFGKSEEDHKYYVLSWIGEIKPSQGYKSKEVASVIYRERVAELAEEIKQQLGETVRAGLAGEVDILAAADAALEYERLKTADDVAVYAAKDWAREFRQTHSEEEVSAWIKDAVAEFRREREAADEL